MVIWNLSPIKVIVNDGGFCVDFNQHHVFSTCLDSIKAVQLKNNHWAPKLKTPVVEWNWEEPTRPGPPLMVELEDGQLLCKVHTTAASSDVVCYPCIYIIVPNNGGNCPVKVHTVPLYSKSEIIDNPLQLPASWVASPPAYIGQP
jgi:hypothetical protein